MLTDGLAQTVAILMSTTKDMLPANIHVTTLGSPMVTNVENLQPVSVLLIKITRLKLVGKIDTSTFQQ